MARKVVPYVIDRSRMEDHWPFFRSFVCIVCGATGTQDLPCDICMAPTARLLGLYDPDWWPTQGRASLYERGFALVNRPGSYSYLVATKEPVTLTCSELETEVLNYMYGDFRLPQGVSNSHE